MLGNDGRRQCRLDNNVPKCPQYPRAHGRPVGTAKSASVKQKQKCLSLASQVSFQFLCLFNLILQYRNIKGTYEREMDDKMEALDWKFKSHPPPPLPPSPSISNEWALNSDLLGIHNSKIYLILYYFVLLQGDEIVS